VSDSTPGSPANNNSPSIKGSAEALSTVDLYTNASCSGAPAASGTAAAFGSPGLGVSVPDDSSTSFYATATDSNNNTGACSPVPFAYVEDSTALPPMLTAVDPAGPANNNGPRVKGSAEAGSTVQLFTNSVCFGAPAVGSAAELAGAGIAVPVPDNFTTTIYGKITDAAGNVSGCSPTGVSYVEDSNAPNTTIARSKAKTRDRTPTVRFTSSEPGSTFTCQVDRKAAKPCRSPFTTRKLKPGKHTIKITAIDAAGNADATPAVRAVKILG
jgi:hypothetical protein